MSSLLLQQLDKLSRYQQKKIWMKRVVGRMPPLFWWSASVFIVAGGIHQLLLPVDTLIISVIAVLPSLLFLLWVAITEKPAVEESVAATDQLLAAKSLFVTAWELSRSSSNTDAVGRLLLERSESELPVWRRFIHNQPQQFMRPATLLSLSLGVTGLFLLQLPSPVQYRDIPHDLQVQPGERPGHSRETATLLRDLFKQPELASDKATGVFGAARTQHHLVKNSLLQKTNPEGEQNAGALNPKDSGQNNTAVNPSFEHPPSGPTLAQSDASAQTGKMSVNKSSTASAKRHLDEAASEHDPFDQIRRIEIPLKADSRTTAFDNTRQGHDLIASRPQNSSRRRAERQYSTDAMTTATSTLLTADQRSMVQRYFIQLGMTDELQK